MKIIIFPFAGGSSYSFNYLKNIIDSKDVSFETIEYSGRGARIIEPLKYDINEIVDDVIRQILPFTKQEYIIYGHSMGALIGFLFCKKCKNININLPEMLIVSGSKGPSLIDKRRISNLESSLFWNEVKKFGGLPDSLLLDDEVKNLFESILKADFKCIEDYQYDENLSKLTIPIDVFYGSEEDITQEDSEAWQEETSGNVSVTQLKGNHFFIFDHKLFFINYFKNLQRNATI